MTAALGAIAVEAVEGWGGRAAVGEAVASVTEGGFPGSISLGGGFKLMLAPDMMRQIMHAASMTAAVQKRCEELCNACNSLAITEGAVYTYQVSTNPTNIRARGRVKPLNFKAVVDDAAHSTMLKALASVGSDPVHVSPAAEEGPESGAPHIEAPVLEGEAAGEGAAAAAEVEEIAEVAVIAL